MFERIPVPTPFEVGRVNMYLAGRTVVDPGPDSEAAWEIATKALAKAGLAPADVERVVITHPHPDHFGLAGRFRERGAAVCASLGTAGVIEDFRGRLEEQAFFGPFLERCGITSETVITLPDAFLAFAPGVETDVELADGDPAGRIEEIRAAHEERTDEVRALLDGPTTPAEVMRGLFGDLPATEIFSGMSEAVGHLDVLEARDRVTCEQRDPELVYEQAD